ncbi:protoporphyrinogen oxidase [Chitinophaga vietnamensis]|uniref:protoporphyrinogen oxidase n=1 Tax=Chitinophaga vietnamensis TaxID=2593957 RepID=UPI001178A7B8|nr:protoporphyrinogen oxidase [Chitinophaga vietnamensis]
MPKEPIIIAGAGLTGLSVAYELQKQQIPYLVMEAASHSGGVIASFHQDGFELDAGPNTIAANPATLAYLRELGLEADMEEAAATSKKRFLVRNRSLHPVSPHPFKIIGSKYISGKSKWRLFTEQFRKSAPVAEEESVTEFVTRRFNQEINEYLFDPILSGIYAGNPDKLSVQEVLPALPRWEREYGSVTKGLMKEKEALGGRKILSLKGGNALLVKRLQEKLATLVQFNCAISRIIPDGDAYRVQYEENGHTGEVRASKVVLALPAYSAAAVIDPLDAATAALLKQLPYPKMGVLHLGFDASALPQPLEGFGFLVPHAEHLHFLGAICNSAIFSGKAPEGKVLFTVFTGGARLEHLLEQQDSAALQQKILSEIQSILHLTAGPVMQRFTVWPHALPQLNTGHAKLRAAVAGFEQKYPGIHVSGNFLHGVAVPALLQHAATLAASLKKN